MRLTIAFLRDTGFYVHSFINWRINFEINNLYYLRWLVVISSYNNIVLPTQEFLPPWNFMRIHIWRASKIIFSSLFYPREYSNRPMKLAGKKKRINFKSISIDLRPIDFLLFLTFFREERHFLISGTDRTYTRNLRMSRGGISESGISGHSTGPVRGPLRLLCSQILSQFSSATRRSAAGRNWLPVLRSAVPICPRATGRMAMRASHMRALRAFPTENCFSPRPWMSHSRKFNAWISHWTFRRVTCFRTRSRAVFASILGVPSLLLCVEMLQMQDVTWLFALSEYYIVKNIFFY